MSRKSKARGGPDHHAVELRSLIELSQVLNSTLDVDALLNTCLLTVMGRMLVGRGLALASDDEGNLSVRVIKGLPDALAQERFRFEHDFAAPTPVAELPDQGCRYKEIFLSLGIHVVVPMSSPTRRVGALCLGGKMNGEPFSGRELEFLNSLSNIAATALENALMFQRLAAVNRRLDRKVQELNTLFEVGKELNLTLDASRILRILQHTVMGQMTVGRMIMLIDDEDGPEVVIDRWRENDDLHDALGDAALCRRLFGLSVPLHLPQQPGKPEFSALEKAGVHAVIPMRLQDETGGVLLLGPRLSGQTFNDEDLDFLSTLCNRVLVSLENVRLFEETLEKQRLEEEMAIAKEIQQRLVPSVFPKAEDYEIFGVNLPSLLVGGDYFDCIPLDGRLALTIGDVSGKGVGAALLMSNLHAALHVLLQSQPPMNELIGRLNELIYRNTNFDKFITLFYAEFDPHHRRLRYVNAGHNPPLLCHADGRIELLEEGGLIIGMLPDVEYAVGSAELESGDLLLAYTDGITDARNSAGDLFEEERLRQLALEAARLRLGAEETARRVTDAVDAFAAGMPQADDITLLVLKLK